MQHDAPDTREYSWQMKALSLVSTTVVLLVFVAVLAGATRLWAAWLALFGSRRVRRPRRAWSAAACCARGAQCHAGVGCAPRCSHRHAQPRAMRISAWSVARLGVLAP